MTTTIPRFPAGTSDKGKKAFVQANCFLIFSKHCAKEDSLLLRTFAPRMLSHNVKKKKKKNFPTKKDFGQKGENNVGRERGRG